MSDTVEPQEGVSQADPQLEFSLLGDNSQPANPVNEADTPEDIQENDPEENIDPREALLKIPADGDIRKPLEELLQQTIRESPIYNTQEALLNDKDPNALLYWAKTISGHAKRMKSYYTRKRKEKSEEDFNFHTTQVVVVYISFHATAISKFEQVAALDPNASFVGLEPDTLAGPPSRPKRVKGQPRFPAMELCFEWGLAALRYGKALETQKDYHAAYAQYNNSAKLFLKVMQEDDRRRRWTSKVLNKIVVVFERLGKVKPTSTDVRTYCDIFLVQFSNIAMRGEMKDQSLKPIIAMVLSDCRHVREANAIDVVRHLANFFDTDLGKEAAKQLEHLESILAKNTDKESQLKSMLTPEAQKRLAKSGLKREEYIHHIDVLINILQWKGKPPCRLSFNHNIDNSEKWRRENPVKLFIDKHKLSDEEGNPHSHVFLAKRKADRVPVAVKVMGKYSENEQAIKKEVALLEFLNKHDNFTHLLDVFLWKDEVWAVCEYCDAGNLVDFIPVSVMKEPEMAYICQEILTALKFLHDNNSMHRDLTSDDILLNMSGDVLVSDFELWMGNNLQRYWLAPELLLSEPYPYGPEVDIWSFGCIVMEMADGHPPYCDLHPLKEFFYTATRGTPPLSKPQRWSVEFKNFLEYALHPDPAKRYTADQLLQHSFIRKACTRQEFSDLIQLKVSWTRW